jgi:hypothetical protein
MLTLRLECVCLTVQVCPRTKGAGGVVGGVVTPHGIYIAHLTKVWRLKA